MHILRCRFFLGTFRSRTNRYLFANLSGFSIKYKEHGDPNSVLEKVEYTISEDLQPKQVLLKMLAAPVNPADINMIQGKYALKPPLPAVGGNEGVAEIVKVGSSVSTVEVGSWVIPTTAGWGTWKTYDVCNEEDITKIDNSIPLVNAATLAVNPCTAYRMIKDFEDVKEGDTIIQNGANSGVGQAVIQIAKHMNINTINIIRDRPNLEALKSHLTSLGANYVVTENDLRTPVMKDIYKKIPKPKLGLNCVGGKSVAELVRVIADKGTVVTYGGMSKQPIAINTACLIFNDIKFRGYWMTRWNKEHASNERVLMLNEMTDIVKKGGLKAPVHRVVKFDDFKDAIAKSMEQYVSQKQILVM